VEIKLLNKQWVFEEITRNIKRNSRIKRKWKDSIPQPMKNTKAVLTGKFSLINVCLHKEKWGDAK
jgi:hypothetical protein